MVTIVLQGHGDRYLGVWHVLVDGELKLITTNPEDVKKFTDVNFVVRNLRPVPAAQTWLDKWLNGSKYDMVDPTERVL